MDVVQLNEVITFDLNLELGELLLEKRDKDKQIEYLQTQHLYLELYRRRENLKFFGIPESEASSLEGKDAVGPIDVLCDCLHNVLGFGDPKRNMEFQQVHRIAKSVPGKPMLILARFLHYQNRETVLRVGFELKDTDEVVFPFGEVGRTDIEFSLLSLNARGIRTFEKRKAIFSWLLNSGANICFLQEPTVLKKSKISRENIGEEKMFFLHGRSHSRGVLVLVRDSLDFQLRSIKVDSQGRHVFLEFSIQESPYFLLNINTPNKCINDSDYCELLTTEYVNWLDKRILWDLIKYKIRQRTITFSKGQARKRGAKLQKAYTLAMTLNKEIN
ncbi:hypothetical protein pdam_00015745 [Pocillopora damicornis]|uniref:Endonuclease/exonuclease/phosphatase domain-containing protein n=1 Tax=Pocillopora damicornis TaxID=46731 RepID=A0A3M6UVE1_POCDA|nr:hypothetical protein pdam_00015745 [Pocillopora damicornis]